MMFQYMYVLLSKLIGWLDARNCNLSNVFVNLQKNFNSLNAVGLDDLFRSLPAELFYSN